MIFIPRKWKAAGVASSVFSNSSRHGTSNTFVVNTGSFMAMLIYRSLVETWHELRKKPSYFPLYWLVYRDPYINWLIKNPHILGSIITLYNLNNQGHFFHCSNDLWLSLGLYLAFWLDANVRSSSKSWPWRICKNKHRACKKHPPKKKTIMSPEKGI